MVPPLPLHGSSCLRHNIVDPTEFGAREAHILCSRESPRGEHYEASRIRGYLIGLWVVRYPFGLSYRLVFSRWEQSRHMTWQLMPCLVSPCQRKVRMLT